MEKVRPGINDAGADFFGLADLMARSVTRVR